ncbi:MAG: agmatine deiminase family protein [Deltaproteobacteria bacterium]|nr:agmatine deiminase family protein [Deltaproteobacteria bacterium]
MRIRWIAAALMLMIVSPAFSAHADFAELRALALTAHLPQMLRLTWNKDRYVDDMDQSGQLARLGITREQAGELWDILAARVGVVPPFKLRRSGGKAAPVGPIRYAAEFEPQTELWMRWPVGQGGILPTYDGMIGAVGDEMTVRVIVACASQENTARTHLANEGIDDANVVFSYWPTDTIWTRDYGPVFVGLGETAPQTEAIIDMSYSRPWRTNDDQIPDAAGVLTGASVYETDFVEDGGNLLTDGQGTCFATSYMFDNNPGWTLDEMEQWFADYLGCAQLIMPEPLVSEGTGHIDMFIKVIGPHTVMVGEAEAGDINQQRLDDAADLIAGATALDGTPFEVVRIPQVTDTTFPLYPTFYTYTNGLLAGETAMVPLYNRAEDDDALAVYETAFPDRDAVQVDAEEVIQSGGALHCVTMERQDYTVESDDDDDADDDAADDDADDDMSDDDSGDDDTGDDDLSDDDADDDGDDSGDDDVAADSGDDDDDGCGC